MTFAEAVYLSGNGGNPTLTLDTGETAIYSSGSGTTDLTFTYTPAAGHTSADLSVVSLNLPINSNIKDTAGNDANVSGAATNPPGGLLVDTTAPTLTSITLDDTALTDGETALVTFQFTEAVSNFSLADVVAANGTLSNLVAGGGNSFTATLTPAASANDDTNVITVGTAWNDVAGNTPAGSRIPAITPSTQPLLTSRLS